LNGEPGIRRHGQDGNCSKVPSKFVGLEKPNKIPHKGADHEILTNIPQTIDISRAVGAILKIIA
jgi:hypothetical protein